MKTMHAPASIGTGKFWRRAGIAAIAAATALGLGLASADARVGGGKSSGSRGANTFSAPPATNTAPKPAAPIERSITQPGKPAVPAASAATQTAANAAKPSMMRNLLLGGLIGAGLASLFGLGGGLAAVLGFMLQALLIGGLVWLAIAFFRSRMQPAGAGAQSGGPMARSAMAPGGPAGLGGAASGATASGNAGPAVNIAGADFDAFERLLGEIQASYGREDIDALGARVTPEMLSYFAHDIEDNKSNGVRNQISGVKLLQGDLAEAWRERAVEYATVAMRFAITDEMVDRASGRKTADASPREVTEVWTFARPTGSGAAGWQLSAIQQA
jgi:predicted lipid-binding transport protein (Tim44 family)